MQEQKIELILNLPNSDQEVEQQELAIPQVYQPIVAIESFEQLQINVHEQIIKKYKPLCLLYQTERTIVLKCLRISQQEQKVIDKDSNSQVVIKFSPFSLRQAKILEIINKKSSSSHIIQCLDLYEDAVVLQSCKQSLAYIIQSEKHIGNQFCLKLLKQCVEMLQVLQEMKIVHFDFKPSNILFRGKDGLIKDFVLTDFGNCIELGDQQVYQKQLKLVNQNIEVYGQSYQYYAPECAQNQRKISGKCDIWGLGCVLFECMTGQSLLPMEISTEQSYNKNFDKFVKRKQIQARLKRYSFPSQYQLFGQLVISMLNKNPSQRPSLKDLKYFLEKNEPK